MSYDQPYQNLFHPYKSWLDKILQIIAFQNFNKIIQLPWSYSDDVLEDRRLRDGISKFRMDSLQKEQGMINYILRNKLKRYTKKIVSIPRNNDVMRSYCDIQMNDIPNFNPKNEDYEFVTVSILCPHNLQVKLFPNNEPNAFNLHDIDPSIPIIIYFHVGGFIMGSSLDLYTVMLFDKLVQIQHGKQKTQPDVIFISVEYRLAPEHPFPSGVIDCLSIMDYVCSSKVSPASRKFHLSGSSAGGNYCTVVTMEHLRRFQDHRILSVFIDIPALDPKANSLSHYKNSKSSIAPWMIWTWRSYLSSKCKDEEQDFTTNTYHVQKSAWMKNGGTSRLIYPTASVPPARNNEKIGKNSIKFLIVTSLADPLHDEGVDLVNKIEEMGYTQVKHFETMSGHATYLLCDRSMAQKIYCTWSSYIFQD